MAKSHQSGEVTRWKCRKGLYYCKGDSNVSKSMEEWMRLVGYTGAKKSILKDMAERTAGSNGKAASPLFS